MGKKLLLSIIIVMGFIVVLPVTIFGNGSAELKDIKALETSHILDSIFAIQGDGVNMYLVKTGDHYIGFDASDNPQVNIDECKKLDILPSLVKAVFLTHSDPDHVKGLSAFPNATVYLSEDEIPVLTGKSPRHIGDMILTNKLPVEKYTTVSDGDSVVFNNMTIHVIAAPGHTPGSVCYRVDESLFTGDLCMLVNGEVKAMIKSLTENESENRKSIAAVAKRNDFERIFTAHSGYSIKRESIFKNWF